MKFAKCHRNREHHAKELCHSCYNAEYRKNNPIYNKRCLEKSKKYSAKLRKIPGYAKDKALKNRYGITLETYNKMLKLQNSRCAICKEVWNKTLHVDHNHVTGKVRGLLCSSCNNIMTKVDKYQFILDSVKEYVKKHTQTKLSFFIPNGTNLVDAINAGEACVINSDYISDGDDCE